MKRGLGTIFSAIDENMGTNLQAFYKHFYIGCLKTQTQQLHFVKKKKIIKIFLYIIILYINNSDRALDNRGGRKVVRAGCSALRNMPSWNTERVSFSNLDVGNNVFAIEQCLRMSLFMGDFIHDTYYV